LDQLIVSIILAVLAAIVLSRTLKGLLRIVAIAIVTFTLIVVSANISRSSSPLLPLSGWLNLRNDSPVVENATENEDVADEDIADNNGEVSDAGTDLSSAPSVPLPDENGGNPPTTVDTPESLADAPLSDSAFTGVTAMVSSPQDPNIDRVLSEFVPRDDSDSNLTQGDGLDANPAESTNPSPQPNPSSGPINALW